MSADGLRRREPSGRALSEVGSGRGASSARGLTTSEYVWRLEGSIEDSEVYLIRYLL